MDLIKIDVEGAEYFVLLGMKNLLKKGNPKLIIEISNKTINLKELLKYLEKMGYVQQGVLDDVKYKGGWYKNILFVKNQN